MSTQHRLRHRISIAIIVAATDNEKKILTHNFVSVEQSLEVMGKTWVLK